MADDIDQIVDNLKQPSNWLRVLFMVGFAILLYVIIAPLYFVLMIVQALFVLMTGESNSNLKYLGASLAQYVLQILLFISYNSDVQPFPFTDFPDVDDNDVDDNSELREKKASASKAGSDDGSSAKASEDTAKPVKRKTAAKKKTAARKRSRSKTDVDKPQDTEQDSDTKA